jgi:hypothetical protein
MKKFIICGIAVALIIGTIFLWPRSSQQIVGVWQDGPTQITFNSDGSLSIRPPDSKGTNDLGGTWQMQGGFLTMVLKNESGSKADGQPGATMRFQILSVDAHHMKFKSGGRTSTMSR